MPKNEKIYQDVWVGGKILRTGTRDSEERYLAIAEVLRRYERPFTVLDLGASEGYFSFRIADEFDAVCVMVEKRAALMENCRKNDNPRVILLQRLIRAGELRRLSEREHFDVVLALNVLHHFGWRWKTAARAVFAMGDVLFLENPPDDDPGSVGRWVRRSINRMLEATPHVVLASTRRRRHIETLSQLRLYERPKARLARPGINLETFARLGGVYPPREVLREQIVRLLETTGRDLAISDLVLHGRELRLAESGGAADPDRARGHRRLRQWAGV